jgi:hypothetical protein
MSEFEEYSVYAAQAFNLVASRKPEDHAAMRKIYEDLKPEVDAVLAEHGGEYMHGGIDWRIADAKGSCCHWLSIRASELAAEKIRGIKGVDSVEQNKPAAYLL